MDFGYFIRRIDQGCHINPGKEAIIFKEKKVTYRQLRDRAYTLAHALKSFGLKKGDRVAVFLKNCLEWFEIFFALASLGAVMVPVNFMLKSKEVEFVINDSGSALLITEDELLDQVDLEQKRMPTVQTIISLGEENAFSLTYSKFLEKAHAEPVKEIVDTNDLLLIQYTSGTTGFPKGAMHTHGTLLWNSFHQIGDFGITMDERYR